MSAARTTISMPEQVYAAAVKRQHDLGYSTFSDYIQALLRTDTMATGGHLRIPKSVAVLNEPGSPYAVNSDPVVAAAAVQIVDAAAAHARAATSEPPPPAKPVKYKVARGLKKKPTP